MFWEIDLQFGNTNKYHFMVQLIFIHFNLCDIDWCESCMSLACISISIWCVEHFWFWVINLILAAGDPYSLIKHILEVSSSFKLDQGKNLPCLMPDQKLCESIIIQFTISSVCDIRLILISYFHITLQLELPQFQDNTFKSINT